MSEFILPILTGICLSACTGFRAFLPPFLAGLAYRFAPEVLPFPLPVPLAPSFAFLTSTPVLVALGVAVVVEFLGDKIPLVDSVLDVLNIPIKMALAAILTFALIPAEAGWWYLLISLAFSETATVTVHAGKTGLRMASTLMTGGVANPVVSTLEDVAAVVGTILAIFIPLACVVFFIWLAWRAGRFWFGRQGGNDGAMARVGPSLWFYRVVRGLFHLFFKMYNRLTIQGAEHFPRQGPYVIVANHASILDGFLLGCSSPHPVHIMVKKEAFENPFSGWFLRKSQAFPVDRSKPDPAAIKKSLRVLIDGQVLGLFPEGTRNHRGLIRPFKPGAIRLAVKQKVPIVPAYLANTNLLMPIGTVVPRPTKLTVAFGEPIDVAKALQEGRTEQEIQDDLYARVCSLGHSLLGQDVRDLTPEDSSGSELSAT
jgi:1-acyl-sn-glycerol-3-phosphate acyltransferase